MKLRELRECQRFGLSKQFNLTVNEYANLVLNFGWGCHRADLQNDFICAAFEFCPIALGTRERLTFSRSTAKLKTQRSEKLPN
jgi:hypothetical protein